MRAGIGGILYKYRLMHEYNKSICFPSEIMVSKHIVFGLWFKREMAREVQEVTLAVYGS